MKDEEWIGTSLTLNKGVKYVGEHSSQEAKADFELWTQCCEHVAKLYVQMDKENEEA